MNRISSLKIFYYFFLDIHILFFSQAKWIKMPVVTFNDFKKKEDEKDKNNADQYFAGGISSHGQYGFFFVWDSPFVCDIFIVLEAVDKLLLVEIKKSMFVTLFGDPP